MPAFADRHPCPRRRRRRPAARADDRASRSGQRRSLCWPEVRGNRSSRVCRCRACRVFSCRRRRRTAGQADTLLTKIADGHNAIVAAGDAGKLQHSRHVVPARDAAHADGADGDAVGGRGGAEDRAGNDGGKSGGKGAGDGGFEKCASCGNHGNLFRDSKLMPTQFTPAR